MNLCIRVFERAFPLGQAITYDLWGLMSMPRRLPWRSRELGGEVRSLRVIPNRCESPVQPKHFAPNRRRYSGTAPR